MSTIRKFLPIVKIALLVGLCLYTVLSSLLFVYLQIRFFDAAYFSKVLLQILAVNTVFLLNLFLSAKELLLPRENTGDRIPMLVCSGVGGVMFLCLAVRSGAVHDWFFAFCTLLLTCISLWELFPQKR